MSMKFTIYGTPQPQGSAKGFNVPALKRVVITTDNKKLKSWRRDVSVTAIDYMSANHLTPIKRPDSVSMVVTFFFPKPPSKAKKIWQHSTRPDLSKLIRALEDGLTGICFEDDSQIDCYERVSKRYGSPARTEVEVWISQQCDQEGTCN